MKGAEVCRDRKQRGVGGERRPPGEKVLKDRRSPRRRGRTGTGVGIERALSISSRKTIPSFSVALSASFTTVSLLMRRSYSISSMTGRHSATVILFFVVLPFPLLPLTPSLRNLFSEMTTSLGGTIPESTSPGLPPALSGSSSSIVRPSSLPSRYIDRNASRVASPLVSPHMNSTTLFSTMASTSD